MSFKEPLLCVIYMVALPRLAIDRFDLRQFLWENILDMVELVSFFDATERA